ncbi:MAG: hypothetical protein IKB01_09000 [Lachnospiraceae bacterium]|nr:hypothetical protein [Lachnospiraceae bacterium]
MSKLLRLKFPLLTPIMISFFAGVLLGIAWLIRLGTSGDSLFGLLSFLIFTGIAFGMLLVYPLILTVMELGVFVATIRSESLPTWTKGLDCITVGLGMLYSLLYVSVVGNATFSSDWDVVLSNAAKHTPIYSQSMPTICVITVIGIIGYFLVNFTSLEKMPPLLLVIGMAAMYLGTLESIIWCVQVCNIDIWSSVYLLLLPVNCVLITAKTVCCKMSEWKKISHENINTGKNVLLVKCNEILMKSEYWPVAAFFLMWPLLGILIALLMLFGQAPDSVIKAWTETSDWNLSQKVSPQNIYYDEHYLCTVAAGGHENVVKPLRLGVRHGHEVIVNRQLCVANAFEQILEERTPGFHRVVRNFYDKYGFPIAKLIHSKYTADLIYILMKPLEWVFLLVIYLCDVHPENRIALQYTGKKVQDFCR